MRLIGKILQEETYLIAMTDGRSLTKDTICKVARNNPKGLYGPIKLGSILNRNGFAKHKQDVKLLRKLLRYPKHKFG